jgi:hypothetical protein
MGKITRSRAKAEARKRNRLKGLKTMLIDVRMAQWWSMLPEDRRQEIVARIPAAKEYGITRTVQSMPTVGLERIVSAYSTHLAWVASLEAKPVFASEENENDKHSDSTDKGSREVHSRNP